MHLQTYFRSIAIAVSLVAASGCSEQKVPKADCKAFETTLDTTGTGPDPIADAQAKVKAKWLAEIPDKLGAGWTGDAANVSQVCGSNDNTNYHCTAKGSACKAAAG